jgi:DNA polymerase elongation subunit (family B)
MFKSEKLHGGIYTSVTKSRNTLYYRGYDASGQRVSERIAYEPTGYVRSSSGNYAALDGTRLKSMRFDSMNAYRDFSKSYSGFAEGGVYGNSKHEATLIHSLFPKEIKYNSSWIDIGSFDIETSHTDENGENVFPDCEDPRNKILSISYKSSKCDHYIAWGVKSYDPKRSELSHLNIEYRQFSTEQELAIDFIEFFHSNCPDILTGWNTRLFDIPYLISRFESIVGTKVKKLSPWGRLKRKEVEIFGKSHVEYDIVGVNCIDYLEIYKKFTYTQQESYSLNNIAHVELNESKLDFSDIGSLRDLYDADYQKFIDYNVKDVELIERFESRLGLLNLVMSMAYMTGCSYTETLGTTSIWDTFIYRRLASSDIIVPPKSTVEPEKVPGGYVKDVVPGKYENIMSFDYASLYPNIMVQCNISPETYRPEYNVDLAPEMILSRNQSVGDLVDYSYACNGTAYSKKKQGIIPEIIEELYSQRKSVKSEMIAAQKLLEKSEESYRESLKQNIALLNTKQMALKILLNSLYGAFANQHFRYYNPALATAVTLTGQTVIRWAEQHANGAISKFLKEDEVKDRTIAVDTDSCYLDCNDIIKKYAPKNPENFLDEFGKRYMEPMFEKAVDHFAKILNSYKNRMVMDREAIASSGVFLAKKRYFLRVLNNEGVHYENPKMKIMGVDAIKSSTPQICRVAMKKLFVTILESDESVVHREIINFKKQFVDSPVEDISFPRGVSELKKWSDLEKTYIKGTPINSKGSLIYNRLLKNAKLDNKYALIQPGDKIKYSYLKKRNSIKETVIAFPVDGLPRELGMCQYIDREFQFQKTFRDPMHSILETIGWGAEEVATLDAFFS